MTTRPDPRYAGYRHPAEIIATAVRLDFRFPLRLRMDEALPAARGITVSDGMVRQWARKSGPGIATRLRRRAPCRGDKWPLDEVVLTIGGGKHNLWRAVGQDGFVPDALVQSRRDTRAAPSLTIGRPAPRRSRSGPKSPAHHWRHNPQTLAARRPRSARRSTSGRCRDGSSSDALLGC